MEIRQVGVAPHTADPDLERYGQHAGIDVARKVGGLRGRLRL